MWYLAIATVLSFSGTPLRSISTVSLLLSHFSSTDTTWECLFIDVSGLHSVMAQRRANMPSSSIWVGKKQRRLREDVVLYPAVFDLHQLEGCETFQAVWQLALGKFSEILPLITKQYISLVAKPQMPTISIEKFLPQSQGVRHRLCSYTLYLCPISIISQLISITKSRTLNRTHRINMPPAHLVSLPTPHKRVNVSAPHHQPPLLPAWIIIYLDPFVIGLFILTVVFWNSGKLLLVP